MGPMSTIRPRGPLKESTMITTPSGLQYEDQIAGTGAEAQTGNTVELHTTGSVQDAKEFDSSRDRDRPFSFKLGAGQVIKGWDERVAGMKVGGKRKLVIPSDLAYGKRGHPGAMPPDSELTFFVELLGVK